MGSRIASGTYRTEGTKLFNRARLKDFNGTMSIVMEHVDKSYEYNHVMRLAATYLRGLLAEYNKK